MKEMSTWKKLKKCSTNKPISILRSQNSRKTVSGSSKSQPSKKRKRSFSSMI